MLEGNNCIIFDCETLRSADACQFCDEAPGEHLLKQSHVYAPIGWEDKLRLSLSIGCTFDYLDGSLHFFDLHTLADTMQGWVTRQAYMVGFNSLLFDGPLLRAILRHKEPPLTQLCDRFKQLMLQGYDILQAVWVADAARQFERGLNSLDAICQAEGFPAKEMDGAMAPRLWAQGRIAEVVQYNMNDVVRTRLLFERILERGEVRRGDGKTLVVQRPDLSWVRG